MSHKKEYTEEETNFLIEHYPTKGGTWCADKLNKKDYNITNFAKRLGLIYTKYPNIDMNMLNDITNENLIYLLGFWWADASLSKYSLRLEISKTDAIDIEQTYKPICTYTLYYRPKRGNDKETATLIINQKDFCSWLEEHDYNRKSYCEPNKILSKIPEEYHYLWWRGFFDGDGHVHVSKKGRYGFSLSGNINLNWESLISLLNKLEVSYALRKVVRLGSSYSTVMCQNKKGFLTFLNLIYQKRPIDNLGLIRKYQKYTEGLLQINHNESTSCQGRISVTLYDMNGQFIKTFRSVKELSDFTGLKAYNIYKKIKTKNLYNKWLIKVDM